MDRDNDGNLLFCLQNKKFWQTRKAYFMIAIEKLNYQSLITIH